MNKEKSTDKLFAASFNPSEVRRKVDSSSEIKISSTGRRGVRAE